MPGEDGGRHLGFGDQPVPDPGRQPRHVAAHLRSVVVIAPCSVVPAGMRQEGVQTCQPLCARCSHARRPRPGREARFRASGHWRDQAVPNSVAGRKFIMMPSEMPVSTISTVLLPLNM